MLARATRRLLAFSFLTFKTWNMIKARAAGLKLRCEQSWRQLCCAAAGLKLRCEQSWRQLCCAAAGLKLRCAGLKLRCEQSWRQLWVRRAVFDVLWAYMCLARHSPTSPSAGSLGSSLCAERSRAWA
ncbi:hypothetical protein HCDSEM_100 [Candidatus Hodgkinia cicadicola Dsem]|nr:hypothetical protein HCDSEM_100 [Candidatus Hodgkinia cicadicola Dsem]